MKSFKPSISYTVQNDLCTGCGICSNACPNDAISFVNERGNFRPVIDETKCRNKLGCNQCYKSCPGIGIDLIHTAEEIHNENGMLQDEFMGRFVQCYTGFSNDKDLRYHAASGGVTSQFLIWLLENQKIDGAVVTKFDKNASLKVKTFVAKTVDDIKSAKSSKYAPTSMFDVFKTIKQESGSRFVVVGLPCQIEGVRKLLSIDKRLRDKICGLFSVYCSGSRTFYFTEYVMKERKIDVDRLDYLAYRDNGCLGGLVAKGENIDFYEDYQSYCHPLRSVFIPRRCILCADHFGELSDISFGDIHIEPYSRDKIGVNSIVARSVMWEDLLLQAASDGVISLEKIDFKEVLKSQKMARIKKKRNVSFCLLLKRIGKKAPDFGSDYDANMGLKTILNYFQIRFQQFVGKNKFLWNVIPLLKARVNIH